MSARHFSYFDDWKNEVLECPKCHWRDTFEQGCVNDYDEFKECYCPMCNIFEKTVLAIVQLRKAQHPQQILFEWPEDSEKQQSKPDPPAKPPPGRIGHAPNSPTRPSRSCGKLTSTI